MQKPELEIHKNTFYTDGRAFAERAPPNECPGERLEGAEASQVRFDLALLSSKRSDAFHKGSMAVKVGLGTFFFNADEIVRGTRKTHIWYFIHPYEQHVYLMVYKNRLGFEYYIPGYGCVNYMFASIFRGNDIERSRLFNGHSPPRIDTTVADERQLWTYACSFGREKFELLADDNLHQMIDLGNEMLQIVSSIQVLPGSTTEDIYNEVKRSAFEERSSRIEDLLRGFDLRNHQIFDVLHSMDCSLRNIPSMFEEY